MELKMVKNVDVHNLEQQMYCAWVLPCNCSKSDKDVKCQRGKKFTSNLFLFAHCRVMLIIWCQCLSGKYNVSKSGLHFLKRCCSGWHLTVWNFPKWQYSLKYDVWLLILVFNLRFVIMSVTHWDYPSWFLSACGPKKSQSLSTCYQAMVLSHYKLKSVSLIDQHKVVYKFKVEKWCMINSGSGNLELL